MGCMSIWLCTSHEKNPRRVSASLPRLLAPHLWPWLGTDNMLFTTHLHSYPQVRLDQLREAADSSAAHLNSVFLALKPWHLSFLSVRWR